MSGLRILVTGAHGMLGTDVVAALADHHVTALSRAELDVTDAEAVDAAVANHDLVINTAAYTKVDDAETHEAEAHAINAVGPALLAEAGRRHDTRLITISTDYVFDGRATTPYAEDHPLNPVSAYGRTKAEGEERALAAHPEGTVVVRTAWLYGAAGPNFAKTMRRLAAQRDELSVVDDQIGQPTWTGDLARRLVEMIESNAPAGRYHGTNSGQGSWFEFARAIFEDAGLDPERIRPTDSASFVRPAPRPAYSVLGHDAWSRIGLAPLRPWRDALRDATRQGATDPSR